MKNREKAKIRENSQKTNKSQLLSDLKLLKIAGNLAMSSGVFYLKFAKIAKNRAVFHSFIFSTELVN